MREGRRERKKRSPPERCRPLNTQGTRQSRKEPAAAPRARSCHGLTAAVVGPAEGAAVGAAVVGNAVGAPVGARVVGESVGNHDVGAYVLGDGIAEVV